MSKKSFTDVMIDIETVGRTPGYGVIQIAAVPFNINTGEVSDNTFCMSINLKEQVDNFGLKWDKSTWAWWMKENPELFKELRYSKNRPVDVASAFQAWFNALPNSNKLRTWGNSNRFDLGILTGFFEALLKGVPFNSFWNTWLERDVRTLAELKPEIKKDLKFEGTKHNAIDDCKHQIKYCHLTIKSLKVKL